MRRSGATSHASSKRRNCLPIGPAQLTKANFRYLKRRVFKPYLKGFCMFLIGLYQKHLSRHTCLYTPTCSEYTKRAINNLGVFFGILFGIWRILRCNPLSKGGFDPAPEQYFKVRWLR